MSSGSRQCCNWQESTCKPARLGKCAGWTSGSPCLPHQGGANGTGGQMKLRGVGLWGPLGHMSLTRSGSGLCGEVVVYCYAPVITYLTELSSSACWHKNTFPSAQGAGSGTSAWRRPVMIVALSVYDFMLRNMRNMKSYTEAQQSLQASAMLRSQVLSSLHSAPYTQAPVLRPLYSASCTDQTPVCPTPHHTFTLF